MMDEEVIMIFLFHNKYLFMENVRKRSIEKKFKLVIT